MRTSELIQQAKDADPFEHGDNFQLLKELTEELERMKRDRDRYWDQCEKLLARNRKLRVALERITMNHHEASEIAADALEENKEK